MKNTISIEGIFGNSQRAYLHHTVKKINIPTMPKGENPLISDEKQCL
jgi:hypothetical protein